MIDFGINHFSPPYFARKGRENATPRVRFEAIAVGVGLALRRNPNLVPHSMEWVNESEFKTHTTTHASNSPARVRGRVEYVRDILLSGDKNAINN